MKDACGADDQYIPYLEVFYCASGGRLWLVVSAWLVVWLLLLFYAMSVVAEVFLCPAVQVRRRASIRQRSLLLMCIADCPTSISCAVLATRLAVKGAWLRQCFVVFGILQLALECSLASTDYVCCPVCMIGYI